MAEESKHELRHRIETVTFPNFFIDSKSNFG